MKILITGAGGLIGSALRPILENDGHQVLPLLRRRGASPTQATWEPACGHIDLTPCGRLEAVVHLAGESIAQRWTPAAKARIRDSRVQGTRLLTEALVQLPHPPAVLIATSATGFYGDRGAELLDEQSTSGTGFLAEVACGWEAAASPARQRQLRVVHLRLGVVLTPRGGALAKLLPVFRVGLGGRVGAGTQYWSWIAVEDVLAIIRLCLTDTRLEGAVNAVAPEPVPNAVFTRTLARVLGRPAWLAVPAFAVRLLLGQMGRETLLASTRAIPARLQKENFRFQFPSIEQALTHMLRR